MLSPIQNGQWLATTKRPWRWMMPQNMYISWTVFTVYVPDDAVLGPTETLVA